LSSAAWLSPVSGWQGRFQRGRLAVVAPGPAGVDYRATRAQAEVMVGARVAGTVPPTAPALSVYAYACWVWIFRRYLLVR
jgi:hypothetical protein